LDSKNNKTDIIRSVLDIVTQWAKSAKKQSVGDYFWQHDNMALYFECRINKNALPPHWGRSSSEEWLQNCNSLPY